MSKASKPEEILGLNKPPIAIGFFESPPAGVPRWEGELVAAGCVFWDKAMNGQTFYTVPSDHYHCAVGSYTHNIALPAERAHELNDAIAFMAENNYVATSEDATGRNRPAFPPRYASGRRLEKADGDRRFA